MTTPSLPDPSTPFIDIRTGMVRQEWFLFLNSLLGSFVSSVSVSGANGIGVSGSPIVTSGTIALTLGALTPASVAATGAVSGSNISGTNTGDQTITLTGDVTGSGSGSFATTVGTTGSWTPADNSGAGLAFTSVSAAYTKIKNIVFAYANWTYPVTASGSSASISGLPFTSANANYAQVPAIVDTSASITGGLVLVPVKNTQTANLDVGTPFGPATNLQLSAATIAVMLIYPVP